MSALPEETRRDRDAAWEPNPPPAPSTSPLRVAAAVAVPDLLRALEPYVNQAATDLARIGPGSRASEGSPEHAKSALEVTSNASGETVPKSLRFAHSTGAQEGTSAIQRTLLDRLDAVRPRLAEPESLFPRADSSSGGSVAAAGESHASGRFETSWPHDVSSGPDAASRAPLTQPPIGDARALEGRTGESSGFDGAGVQTIAELATRLLQAATRLEQLAQRHMSEAPLPYRSTPRPFRDRVEG
ncbi:MAG: hypothetical protein ACLP7Q_09055 [Isosphaeraceae bacterium]